MTENPLLVFQQEIENFKTEFDGDESDFSLLCDYPLMPIFDVDSINDLQITATQRHRLYYLMKTHSDAIKELLQSIGYSCFFTQLK